MRYIMSLFLIFVGLLAFAVAKQAHYGEGKQLMEIGWIAFPGGAVLLVLERFVWRKTPRPQIR